MGQLFRMEGAALAALEQKEAQAAEQGPEATKAFKDQSETEAIEKAKDLGVSPGGDSTSSSSSSSDDSSSSEDSGGDDFGSEESGDDMSDDMPDFDSEESEEEPEEEEEENTDEDPSEEEEKPEEEPEEEEETKDEETELKKESFRTLSFLPAETQELRMERYGFPMRMEFMPSVHNLGLQALGGLSFVANALMMIGITYGPALLVGMYKVVLFTFCKTLKTLDEGFDFLTNTVVRYINRTEKQMSTIEVLKKDLGRLQTQGASLPENPQGKVNTTFLEFGTSHDYQKNIEDYTRFLSDKIQKLNNSISRDFDDLEKIAENRYLGKTFEPMEYMRLNPASFGFMTVIDTTPTEGIQLDTYTMGRMIGNVELQAKLTSQKFDNWNSIEKAYSLSKINLVNLKRAYGAEESKTQFLSPEELVSFLNKLELLAKASLKHQASYKDISGKRAGIMNSMKQLFVRLAEEDGKVSFKNSVALPLHLKSGFVTKVYMAGAMDLHDHTAQVIANGLSYASSMMKLYVSQTK